MIWLNGRTLPLRQLVLEELLPLARRGLLALEIDTADARDYLAIIAARVETGRTGAGWQRDFFIRHGTDPTALTLAYLDRQRGGLPVHEWPC